MCYDFFSLSLDTHMHMFAHINVYLSFNEGIAFCWFFSLFLFFRVSCIYSVYSQRAVLYDHWAFDRHAFSQNEHSFFRIIRKVNQLANMLGNPTTTHRMSRSLMWTTMHSSHRPDMVRMHWTWHAQLYNCEIRNNSYPH